MLVGLAAVTRNLLKSGHYALSAFAPAKSAIQGLYIARVLHPLGSGIMYTVTVAIQPNPLSQLVTISGHHSNPRSHSLTPRLTTTEEASMQAAKTEAQLPHSQH